MNDNYNRIASVAQGVSNQIGGAFAKQADRSAIDEILEGASQSGNERDIDMAIGQILSRVSPERQGQALQILEQKKSKISNEKELVRRQKALVAANLSPDLAHLESSTLNNILNNTTKENVANANATSRQNVAQTNATSRKEAAETAATSRKTAAETVATGRKEAAKILADAKKAEQQVKPAPKSEFQKKLEGKYADEYVKNQQDIAKATSQLKTVDELKKLGKQLTGASGYIKGVTGFGEAAEYDALGLTLAEAPIKIFNPVGAIPESKIKRVVEKFSPKASDSQATQNAKIKAAELIIKNAKERAEGRNRIIEQYDGSPPSEAFAAYDKETESLVDAWDTYADTTLKEEINSAKNPDLAGLPNAAEFPNKKIKNKKTGKTLISNGQEWVQIE